MKNNVNIYLATLKQLIVLASLLKRKEGQLSNMETDLLLLKTRHREMRGKARGRGRGRRREQERRMRFYEKLKL